MKMELPEKLQKKVKRYGSLLKACRTQGGKGAVLLFLLSLYFIFMGVLVGIVSFVAGEPAAWSLTAGFFGIGFVMLLLWFILSRISISTYLSFFQKETGYSVRELEEADRELMGYSAVKIGAAPRNIGRKPIFLFIVTAHYFVAVGSNKGCYLRKLSDIAAAFYSCQVPQAGGYREGLFLISRQDIQKKPHKNRITKKWFGGFESGMMVLVRDCEKVCAETLEEMRKRAPHIIPYQNIVVNGIQYNLMSMNNWQADWARILGE
jgi:hypothetical protein